MQSRQVLVLALLAIAHLLDAVVGVGEFLAGAIYHQRVRGNALVVQVQVGQLATSLGEGPEVGGRLYSRYARQFLAQVVGEAFAVVGRVQQAVDIKEDVFAGDGLAGVGGLEVRQPFRRDGLAAPGCRIWCRQSGFTKQSRLLRVDIRCAGLRVVEQVKREILRAHHVRRMKTGDAVADEDRVGAARR